MSSFIDITFIGWVIAHWLATHNGLLIGQWIEQSLIITIFNTLGMVNYWSLGLGHHWSSFWLSSHCHYYHAYQYHFDFFLFTPHYWLPSLSFLSSLISWSSLFHIVIIVIIINISLILRHCIHIVIGYHQFHIDFASILISDYWSIIIDAIASIFHWSFTSCH